MSNLELYDLIFFAVLCVLLVSVLLMVGWKRWNWHHYSLLSVTAILIFLSYRALLSQILHVLMLPTLAWWDLERDYGIWFVEPFPMVPTLLGTFALLTQYVLIANRLVGTPNPTRRGRTPIVLQIILFILGGSIATVVYPSIVAAALIPAAESKTSGDGILIYAQGLHTAVLASAVGFSVLAAIVSVRVRSKGESVGSGDPEVGDSFAI
jgi:hypothetical protein